MDIKSYNTALSLRAHPMPRVMSVSDSIVVALDPAAVYAQVSDPTRMGRWSPENTGATVPAGGVAAGTVFEGHNKRGPVRWTTRCVVLAAEPGARFTFRVEAMGLFDRAATRGHVFADFQRRNIATTLANLKTALESTATR